MSISKTPFLFNESMTPPEEPIRNSLDRRRFICTGLGCFAAGILLPEGLSAARKSETVLKTRKALGTKVSIQVIHPDPGLANQAITEAFDAIERVERSMSLYRPNSEISRLNRDGYLPSPTPALTQVLNTSQQLSEESLGAFDITVQPLWELFQEHARKSALPRPALIEERKARLGWQGLLIEAEAIRSTKAGTQITLNGIAQGFATDQAKQALLSAGIRHALIDCGELGSIGKKAQDRPWKVGIQHPRQPDAFTALAPLEERCLATSGDYETSFSTDFKHHHIFDPRTGASPTDIASASVLAPTAMEADALSTTFMVMGVQEGLAFVERKPETDALLFTKNGQTFSTEHFPRFNL